MHPWFRAPSFDDIEVTGRARVLGRLLAAMLLLSLVSVVSALLDAQNDLRVTVTFYALVWGWLAFVWGLVRGGRVLLAAWVLGLSFWAMIAFVTLVFGGMQGNNAATFAVCTLLIGSVVGGRPAILIAVASSLWCAFVAYLESTGKLPAQLGPYTPFNAWGAVTGTVLLTAVLLQESLQSLQRVHAAAQRTAAERDDALRKSIHSQKMELVGNLTSGVAHDLNNLLTVITSTSDLLRSQVTPNDDEAQALLDDLEGAASRASLMTSQLLSFGRVRTSDTERVDLGSVLSAIGSMLPRLLGPTLKVEVRSMPGCWIVGARSGIEQILLNLAVNARDAMPNGGTFSLSVESRGQRVVLEARDTGIGMSQTLQERIFEPFFSTKTNGTGLGLSTVRKLVDLFHGTIQVESKPAVGTSFRLQFALAEPKSGKSGEQHVVSLAPSQTQTKRILLVEDDPLVRGALARGLAKDGFEVHTAADGVEAVERLARLSELHCIVSDVAMPRLDGEALARHVAETQPNLPMVLFSGNQEPSSALVEGLPRTFLMKPVTREALRAAILKVTSEAE